MLSVSYIYYITLKLGPRASDNGPYHFVAPAPGTPKSLQESMDFQWFSIFTLSVAHISYINGSPGPSRHGPHRLSGTRCTKVCPCRLGLQGLAALIVPRCAPAGLARGGPRPSLYQGVPSPGSSFLLSGGAALARAGPRPSLYQGVPRPTWASFSA